MVLDNLIEMWKIDAQTERVIAALAKADYEGIWQFFGRRLERKADKSAPNAGYDPIRINSSKLKRVSVRTPTAPSTSRRGWYRADDPLFPVSSPVAGGDRFRYPALSDKLIAVIAAEREASLGSSSAMSSFTTTAMLPRIPSARRW